MDCPSCDKTLASERGMRQHHAMAHDTPLPNRTCVDCGSEFHDPKSRRKYCSSCDPNVGRNNGNWSDAKETAVCRTCGTSFEYYPSEKDGVYCKKCILAADGLLPDNPAERNRIETQCTYCGTVMSVVPSRIDNSKQGVFCTRTCHGAWLSKHVVGPNHHQWEGGTIDYGGSWWRVRRRALTRDNYRCQQCGRPREELGRNPDVHHIERVRDFEDPREAHTLSNVISLCRSCHQHVEAGNIPSPSRNSEG
ncbi:HNH endonuclease [Haloplanus rubicundus]|uniref:HNH endonuclease n=2 Tax=Haloplanus rubicundus TaxID=1547898 RepID=A0A345E241_9EURY|nr:HNH endonuclease [Haloplanus rubicundus]